MKNKIFSLFYPLLLAFKLKGRFYILLLPGLIILTGCFQKYYSRGTTHQVDSVNIENLKTADKYFIIHYKDSVLQLYDVGFAVVGEMIAASIAVMAGGGVFSGFHYP